MENISATSNVEALDKLITLSHVSAGGFIVCTYDHKNTFDTNFIKLRGKLDQKNIKLIDLGKNVSFSELEEIMAHHENHKKEILKIKKIIYSIKWDIRDFKKAVSNYNVRRDFYMPNFGANMIFWIPKSAQSWLINETPDFWRVRLGTVSFQLEMHEQHLEIMSDIAMSNEQRDYIKGLRTLQIYYSTINDWTKSRKYYVKAEALKNRFITKKELNGSTSITKLVNLACRLTEKGFSEAGSNIRNIAMDSLKEPDGSVRSVKGKNKQKIKSIYKKFADSCNDGGDYLEAARLYGVIMDNTHTIRDVRLRHHTRKKLNELMTISYELLKIANKK